LLRKWLVLRNFASSIIFSNHHLKKNLASLDILVYVDCDAKFCPQEEPVVEDEANLSFHLPMPSFPPPELPADVDDVSSTPTNFLVVAIYDYESDHPEDLNFKVIKYENDI
jgi:hypothetical protein